MSSTGVVGVYKSYPDDRRTGGPVWEEGWDTGKGYLFLLSQVNTLLGVTSLEDPGTVWDSRPPQVRVKGGDRDRSRDLRRSFRESRVHL